MISFSCIDAIKKTFRSEGIVGMYRGSLVNIILVTPEKSTKLAANDFFRHHYQTRDGKLPLLREILAGASAGLCAIGITTPMELIKIQMQDAGRVNAQLRKSGKPPIDASFMRVVTNIMKSDGPLGFFKGVSATFYRDFAFAVIYFPLFANLRAAGFTMVDSSGNSQFLVNFVSGAASGIISAVAVTPADVMKTRFQTTTKGQGEKTYSGTLDAISTIMKHEGPKAFFKGGACRAMVIGPLYAIAQVVYYIGIGEYFFGVDSAA
ncbi:unnamed protein product [Acanthoscelides obtectus]|uniref:Uncharacterized protein n=1 Tax=Acanthoscelides obtectus TaxID=200917 RepID=A0A9P0MDI0_ACAOB|nr:unnamed protein product [Acanthoscelides obtectus]CAK1654627.1 Mitochondrial glutamate carrier 1 [Acanthoscelides obtectus]